MYIYISCLVVSTYPSEKYDFVSWDDDIPNMMGKHLKFHGSSHHQPEHIEESWEWHKMCTFYICFLGQNDPTESLLQPGSRSRRLTHRSWVLGRHPCHPNEVWLLGVASQKAKRGVTGHNGHRNWSQVAADFFIFFLVPRMKGGRVYDPNCQVMSGFTSTCVQFKDLNHLRPESMWCSTTHEHYECREPNN